MSSWSRLLRLGGVYPLTASGRKVADDPISRINEGVMYHCSLIDAALANNANLDMMINAPAGDPIHMIMEVGCGGTAELGFFEGVAATGGDVEAVYNHKRTSSRVWGGTMVSNPSISDLGTRLISQMLPAGSRNQASGGASSFEAEWILQTGINYLMRVTNRSGSAQVAFVGCDHYSSPLILDT